MLSVKKTGTFKTPGKTPRGKKHRAMAGPAPIVPVLRDLGGRGVSFGVDCTVDMASIKETEILQDLMEM